MKFVAASQHKRYERNLCQDLLTIENTDSDLKVHELHYANELVVRVSCSFQQLLQTHQTSRNNKQPSKQVLVMINHCRYQSREFSCYILKSEQTQKHTRKLTTSASISYYSFSAGDRSLVFDPEKPTFSVSSEHKTTYKRAGSYSLPYSLPSL